MYSQATGVNAVLDKHRTDKKSLTQGLMKQRGFQNEHRHLGQTPNTELPRRLQVTVTKNDPEHQSECATKPSNLTVSGSRVSRTTRLGTCVILGKPARAPPAVTGTQRES